MFGLGAVPSPPYSPPPFLQGNAVCLANARSGIAVLIELLSPVRVWMPSYFCGHVLKAVGKLAAEVRYFEVDYDLELPSLDWIASVRPDDLVVMADYFGFPCSLQAKKLVKEQGAWLLEDACQALLSEDVGQLADFVLFSPRKFLGVPDGGVLAIKCGILPESIPLTASPEEWWLQAFSASLLRREFDGHGGDRRWFELFQESEVNAPMGAYAMGELSRLLILYGFDYAMIADQRIRNYKLLAHDLGEYSLFPRLPDGVVPLGFPIRLADRDRVRQTLFRNDIYPPVHWPVRGIVPEEYRGSSRLSSEIMTLPCDQRYGKADMERMIAILQKEITP